MYKSYLGLITLTLLFLSCNKEEQNPFKIGKYHIGLLNDSTQIKELKTIFSKDSITTFINGNEFHGSINNIDIFEKGGKKLLTLTPKQALDSTSVIESIEVVDPRYKTAKDISISSTFKDITNAYKISKINNLINSIHIAVKEINASFVIDKKELPSNIRYNMDLRIESIHIPDNAKIKYFFISWNNNN